MYPQWFYDLTEPSQATGTRSTIPVSKIPGLPKPAIFKSTGKSGSTGGVKRSVSHEQHLKVKRAWEIALAPAKALPMNLIMSYFSGNSLQIMTISMTLYMFFITPVNQILALNTTFGPLHGKDISTDILFAKIAYIICCLLALGAGVWKVGQMGLLPTHSTDWVAWETPAKYFISTN